MGPPYEISMASGGAGGGPPDPAALEDDGDDSLQPKQKASAHGPAASAMPIATAFGPDWRAPGAAANNPLVSTSGRAALAPWRAPAPPARLAQPPPCFRPCLPASQLYTLL